MSTLEDKILGEKKEYYCSSSSGSEDENGSASDDDLGKEKDTAQAASATAACPADKWQGVSTNTGPKGVIKDWQRYKQMQTEQRGDKDKEMVRLAKKLNLTSSQPPPQPAADSDEEFLQEWEDQYLEDYRKQRMKEMMQSYRLPTFGQVLHLNGGCEFLDAIDKEDKKVTVVIHIYEETVSACKSMNKCLNALSKQYPTVKFCRMVGSTAGMSHRFKVDGVPALLAYKEGQIIGNFVRMTDELGDEFYEGDVENFLIEHGILTDRYCVPEIVQGVNRSGLKGNEDDEEGGGSDWSLE